MNRFINSSAAERSSSASISRAFSMNWPRLLRVILHLREAGALVDIRPPGFQLFGL